MKLTTKAPHEISGFFFPVSRQGPLIYPLAPSLLPQLPTLIPHDPLGELVHASGLERLDNVLSQKVERIGQCQHARNLSSTSRQSGHRPTRVKISGMASPKLTSSHLSVSNMHYSGGGRAVQRLRVELSIQ